ncbi:MAG: pilus assembly protein [Bacilli bacterium]|nr:pilus assembly protein [Bacilli bacterium]
MLNNKGQSLVMFILIIPIFFGIMVLVIDIGNVIYYKQDIDNINKVVINYGLSHMDDEDVLSNMKELAKLNNKDLSIEIVFNDMEYYVSSSYYVNGIFSSIFKMKGFNIKSKYKGYKDIDKDIIKKIN